MVRMTPARRHFQRAMAAQAAEARAAAPMAGGEAVARAAATEYELTLAELDTDLRALKVIQAIDRKIALKRELLPKYDAWVGGVIDAKAKPAPQDNVLLHMMLWALDAEDYDRALDTVTYVLDNGLAMPAPFTRTAPTVIAEISAENALGHLSQGEACNLDWLTFVEDATKDGDMLDVVRAKLHKAMGLAYGRRAESDDEKQDGAAVSKSALIEQALLWLRSALRLDGKAGVKKEIERLERLLKAQAAS